jgi:hypothetical protein
MKKCYCCQSESGHSVKCPLRAAKNRVKELEAEIEKLRADKDELERKIGIAQKENEIISLKREANGVCHICSVEPSAVPFIYKPLIGDEVDGIKMVCPGCGEEWLNQAQLDAIEKKRLGMVLAQKEKALAVAEKQATRRAEYALLNLNRLEKAQKAMRDECNCFQSSVKCSCCICAYFQDECMEEEGMHNLPDDAERGEEK